MKLKTVFILLLIFSSISCSKKSVSLSGLTYYLSVDKYNEMSVWFKSSNDSIYFYYCNIIDNGQYLNCPYDSNDYADYFLINELKETLNLKIKNYRDENECDIVLTFSKDKDTLFWEIKSKVYSYLPHKAILIKK